jgi:hypothetical protein
VFTLGGYPSDHLQTFSIEELTNWADACSIDCSLATNGVAAMKVNTSDDSLGDFEARMAFLTLAENFLLHWQEGRIDEDVWFTFPNAPKV